MSSTNYYLKLGHFPLSNSSSIFHGLKMAVSSLPSQQGRRRSVSQAPISCLECNGEAGGGGEASIPPSGALRHLVGSHSDFVQGMPRVALTPREPLTYPVWGMLLGSRDGF